MALGENRPDIRLLKQIALDPPDEKGLIVGYPHVLRLQLTCANGQHADIGAARSAGQLRTGIERHFQAVDQADLSAEERKQIGASARDTARRVRTGAGKAEHPGALEKERPLLGKQ